MADESRLKFMIAGTGGASLGTECVKCLRLAVHYGVYGCDIFSTSRGMYDRGFTQTFLVERERYIDAVISACRQPSANYPIPGREEFMVLLGGNSGRLSA